MQPLKLIAALAVVGFAARANAAGDDLESRVTASDGWVAYHVPMVAGVDGLCCYWAGGRATTTKGCDLDGRSWSFGTDHDDPAVAADDLLAVYLRVERGRVERVRAVRASCPVQTAGTVRWIDSVDPASSVAMLSSLFERKGDEAAKIGLDAVAYHADTSATRVLAARAEPSHPLKEREQALFWLGQTRGVEGADVVLRYATTDPDAKLRRRAIFPLSQAKAPGTYAHILKISRDDPAERVRGDALFWLAQMDDVRAKDDIIALMKTESSDKVREQAVFALTQLGDGDGDEALIAVLRGEFPRAVKKQALFWLGQSASPRAMAYFDEVLK